MRKHFIILFIIVSIINGSTINQKAIKKIDNLFPNALEVKDYKIRMTDEQKRIIELKLKQKFYSNELHAWDIYTNNGIYTAVLDNVYGKSMPITFLAIFDNKNSIYNVSIIKYREPYGGEVKNKRWLKQFYNFTYSSDFKIGSQIDGISGATISTNSISTGINKLALLFEIRNYENLLSNE